MASEETKAAAQPLPFGMCHASDTVDGVHIQCVEQAWTGVPTRGPKGELLRLGLCFQHALKLINVEARVPRSEA